MIHIFFLKNWSLVKFPLSFNGLWTSRVSLFNYQLHLGMQKSIPSFGSSLQHCVIHGGVHRGKFRQSWLKNTQSKKVATHLDVHLEVSKKLGSAGYTPSKPHLQVGYNPLILPESTPHTICLANYERNPFLTS